MTSVFVSNIPLINFESVKDCFLISCRRSIKPPFMSGSIFVASHRCVEEIHLKLCLGETTMSML